MRKQEIQHILNHNQLLCDLLKRIEKSYLLISEESPVKTILSNREPKAIPHEELKQLATTLLLQGDAIRNIDKLIQYAQETEFKELFGLSFDFYRFNLDKSIGYKTGQLKPIEALDVFVFDQKDKVHDTYKVIHEFMEQPELMGKKEMSAVLTKTSLLNTILTLREQYTKVQQSINIKKI